MKQWTLEVCLKNLDSLVMELTGDTLQDRFDQRVEDLLDELVQADFNDRMAGVQVTRPKPKGHVPGQTSIQEQIEEDAEGKDL